MELQLTAEPSKVPLIIYHSPCADGTAAAWVAYHYFNGKVELYPTTYGKELKVDPTGRDVFIVDFSYLRNELLCICEDANHVTLIDHHKKAIEDLIWTDGEPFPANLSLILDTHRSGCILTWDHFFPMSAAPELLKHIQDYDLWRFSLQGTKEIIAAYWAESITVENFWYYASSFHTKIWDAEEIGAVLVKKKAKDLQDCIEAGMRWVRVAGEDVPIINAPYSWASGICEKMMKDCNAPFAVCYTDLKDVRKWSLRSEDHRKDVNEIAKLFGGGGHRNAAGFTTSMDFMFPASGSPIESDLTKESLNGL